MTTTEYATLVKQIWNRIENLDDEEGHRKIPAIDENLLRAIKVNTCETIQVIAEELKIDHLTVIQHLY